MKLDDSTPASKSFHRYPKENGTVRVKCDLIQTLGIHSTARPEKGVIGDGGHVVVTESVRGGEGQERRLLIGVLDPLEETALQTRSR